MSTWTPWGGQSIAEETFGPLHLYEPANDNSPLVVAFTGAAGSGKSTAADYLIKAHGYTRIKFAGPLKAAMRSLGLSDAHIEGDLKEAPSALLCGKTPRFAMQTFGTEWGRKTMGDDFWVGLWRASANDVIEAGGRVVCDDCRFQNEAAAVRKLGGDIYRLVGRGGLAGSHESERMDFGVDDVIENDAGRDDLGNMVEAAMKRYV